MTDTSLSVDDANRIFAKLQIQSKRTRNQVAGFLVVDGAKVLNLQFGLARDQLAAYECERFRTLLHVTRDELAELRDCTLSRAGYIELLRARRVIPDAPVAAT